MFATTCFGPIGPSSESLCWALLKLHFCGNKKKKYIVIWFAVLWQQVFQTVLCVLCTRKSAAVRLLRLRVRIPPGSWMSVCSECCVLSGRGLCDKLITRPEESYRLCCVVVCDLETSRMRTPWHALGRSATGKKKLLEGTYQKLTILVKV
jgi:hypothetical protein